MHRLLLASCALAALACCFLLGEEPVTGDTLVQHHFRVRRLGPAERAGSRLRLPEMRFGYADVEAVTLVERYEYTVYQDLDGDEVAGEGEIVWRRSLRGPELPDSLAGGVVELLDSSAEIRYRSLVTFASGAIAESRGTLSGSIVTL